MGLKILNTWDFPGGTVVKILCCQFRGLKFNPRSGHMPCSEVKCKKEMKNTKHNNLYSCSHYYALIIYLHEMVHNIRDF